MPSREEVERWKLIRGIGSDPREDPMQFAEDGDWVRFEDYRERLEEAEAKAFKLQGRADSAERWAKESEQANQRAETAEQRLREVRAWFIHRRDLSLAAQNRAKRGSLAETRADAKRVAYAEVLQLLDSECGTTADIDADKLEEARRDPVVRKFAMRIDTLRGELREAREYIDTLVAERSDNARVHNQQPSPKDPVERGEIEAAFLEQAELYRREAAEERERGAQGGWEKLTAAAEVVACVTRIVFDTPEDMRRRVNASIDDPDSPGWAAIRAGDRARLNQTTSSPKDGGGGDSDTETDPAENAGTRTSGEVPAGAAVASTSSTEDTETPAVEGRVAWLDECDVPPTGWRCTRGRGHDGPCAAIPTCPPGQPIRITYEEAAEKLRSPEAMYELYCHAPGLDSDNDAGPSEDEEAILRPALDALAGLFYTQPNQQHVDPDQGGTR